jgi:hypothetical protein
MFQTKVVEKIKTHLKMRFSFRIPKAREQTHSHYVYYLLLQNWLIASDLVQCLTATHTAHYELFSQTVPLKKTKSTFFRCSVGHCTWRPAYVLLLPATWIYHKSTVVQYSVTCSSTTLRMHCCISTATMVTRTRHYTTYYVHRVSCFYFLLHFALFPVCLFVYSLLSSPSQLQTQHCKQWQHDTPIITVTSQ